MILSNIELTKGKKKARGQVEKKLNSSRQETTSLINVNEVWVAVPPTGTNCVWNGKNKFRVICCKEAFSIKSTCKFAFCPQCAVKVREDVEKECDEEPGENKRARSSRRPKKSQCDTGAISQSGE